MKVFLNADVKHLGEEGDVKTVANGYARNYLFPRNLALPYNEVTIAHFEGRKEEIESKKVAKRAESASLAEKISAHTITIVMPAGPNGKLYGAVTSQTVAEYLNKDGFEIERKRIEVPGLTIKSIGKYVVRIRLYEATSAELTVLVEPQEEVKSTKTTSTKSRDRRPVETTEETPAQDAEPSDNVATESTSEE